MKFHISKSGIQVSLTEPTEQDEQKDTEVVLRNRSVGRQLGWSILIASSVISILGITLLPGTAVGFAMFMGGGILAFEAYLLLDLIREKSKKENK